MTQLPALTGLRFLLASWVILHHLTGRKQMLDAWVHSLPAALQSLVRQGYLAVGTFFVLSGFVLARSYASTSWNGRSLVKYGAGRLARVYPVYLLSLILILPFAFEDLVTPGRANVVASGKGFLIASYGFVLQGWSRLPVNWNTPAWSLSCELFFYLCFPAAVFLLARAGRTGIILAAVAAIGAPLWYRWTAVPLTWKPVIHLADFIAGIVTAAAFDAAIRWKRGILAGRGYWLYGPAIAAMILFASVPGLAAPVDLNSALRPVNVLLLIGLGLGGGIPFRALSLRISVFLGQSSYSMYILHIPLLWWYRRMWLHTSGLLTSTASAAVYFGSVVAASAAVYRYFEEPANRAIRKWITERL